MCQLQSAVINDHIKDKNEQLQLTPFIEACKKHKLHYYMVALCELLHKKTNIPYEQLWSDKSVVCALENALKRLQFFYFNQAPHYLDGLYNSLAVAIKKHNEKNKYNQLCYTDFLLACAVAFELPNPSKHIVFCEDSEIAFISYDPINNGEECDLLPVEYTGKACDHKVILI